MVKPTKEVLAQGESIVNDKGTAYVGRKYAGKKIVWVVPKDQED